MALTQSIFFCLLATEKDICPKFKKSKKYQWTTFSAVANLPYIWTFMNFLFTNNLNWAASNITNWNIPPLY